jgi:hypothetical protein
MGSWLKFLAVFAFLFLLVPVSFPWVSATNGDAVPLEVAEAEEALVSAYEVILEAEESGANVSDLLDKLNVGGEYLAEAYVWVRLGNSENTNRFAALCYDIAEDVQSDAVELRDYAKDTPQNDFVAVMFRSVVGVIFVVGLCFVGWLVFKWRYHKKVVG